jgi:hypothetical protein
MDVCVLQLTANRRPEQRVVLFIYLGWTAEKTVSNRSSLVSQLSLIVCMFVCVCPLALLGNDLVTRQWFSKHFLTTANTHAATETEELLDLSFSVRSVSYQRKVGS